MQNWYVVAIFFMIATIKLVESIGLCARMWLPMQFHRNQLFRLNFLDVSLRKSSVHNYRMMYILKIVNQQIHTTFSWFGRFWSFQI